MEVNEPAAMTPARNRSCSDPGNAYVAVSVGPDLVREHITTGIRLAISPIGPTSHDGTWPTPMVSITRPSARLADVKPSPSSSSPMTTTGTDADSRTGLAVTWGPRLRKANGATTAPSMIVPIGPDAGDAKADGFVECDLETSRAACISSPRTTTITIGTRRRR